MRNEEKNREYHRAYYYAHKDVINARSSAWSAAHKEQRNAYHVKHYRENRARALAAAKARRERYEALGICVDCGKNTPAPGCKRCEPCLAKIRARQKRYRGHDGTTPGE